MRRLEKRKKVTLLEVIKFYLQIIWSTSVYFACTPFFINNYNAVFINHFSLKSNFVMSTNTIVDIDNSKTMIHSLSPK